MGIAKRNPIFGLATLLLWWIPGCSPTQGAPKFPVTGTVLVNGEPAAGMIVRFHGAGQGLVGQDAQPAAVTDENGVFELSSFGDGDGAAAAKYKVTFYWPTNPILASEDRLQGRFSQAALSEIDVLIDAEATTLPPFELEIDEDDLLPAVEFQLPAGAVP
ncbi:MAG: hypothetical protein AAF670_05490 [Planctomycetota bacterium]